jgi:autotransporter-associated beta strand protein
LRSPRPAEGATAAVTNGAELQFTRDVTGDAKLTKTGDGRLLLAGTNTYSGGTDVLKGYVDVSGSQALGAGAVTFNGGFLGSKGEGATVDNPVTVLSPMQVVTYSPLTLFRGVDLVGQHLFGQDVLQ